MVMPGIGLYRIQADRSGDYAGAKEPEFGLDVTLTLIGISDRTLMVGIRPQHARRSSVQRERILVENATAGRDTTAPNAMWKKRPWPAGEVCRGSYWQGKSAGSSTAEDGR
jgi:hypothetical protein